MAESKHEDESNDVGSLLKLNRIHYKTPNKLNVVNSRKMVKIQANKSEIPHTGTLEFGSINTGELFVNGRESYLRFKIKSSGVTTGLKNGSLGLIKSVIISTESGTEVCHEQDVYLRATSTVHYMYGKDYMNSIRQLTGTDLVSVGAGEAGNLLPVAKEVILPLSVMSGLFDTDQLMPGLGLMAGMRIQITFSNPEEAIESAGAVTYTISDPYLMLDCYQLSDAVLRTLNSISSKQGLQFTFKDWHSQKNSVNGTNVNIQVNKSMSVAEMVFTKIRTDAHKIATATDSLESDEFKCLSYQYNLGANYFPQQPLITAVTDLARPIEAYKNAIYAFDTGDKAVDMTLAEFHATKSVLAATLERSSVDLSALPVGAARSLVLNATLSDAVNRELVTCVRYVKVLQIYLDKTILKD